MRTYTKEYVIDLAKHFRKEHKRVPRSTELGLGPRKRIYEYWKDWSAFIREALGEEPVQRSWTDDELLQWLRDLYRRLNRFPTHTDIDNENPSVIKLIYIRFGDLQTAFDRAIGTSPRAEVLLALQKLTPPGCDTASTQEIHGELISKGINTSKQVVANTLDYLKRNSLVIGGRYSQTAWWTLTAKGRELIAGMKKEKGNGRRRD